jgi:hypothetical protein
MPLPKYSKKMSRPNMARNSKPKPKKKNKKRFLSFSFLNKEDGH